MRTRTVALIAFSLAALVALSGAAAAQSGDPTPTVPRWIDSEYDLTLEDGLEQLTLDGQVDIHEVETPQDNRNLQRLCGTSCSADELREAYQRADENGKQDLVNAIEDGVETQVEAALSGIAGPDAEPISDATVSEQALQAPRTGWEYKPPIPVNATGSTELGLIEGTDYSPTQIDALFRMGARVTQDIDQNVRPGTNLTMTLAVPDPLRILEAQRGTVSSDGVTVTWSETNWQGESASSIEDTLRLGDPDVVVPQDADAGVNITLDISDVDANYGGLLGGGNAADAQVAIRVDGQFRSIENPEEVDQVELDYLSADAVRIALENNLLEASQITGFEDRTREQIKTAFRDTFGAEVDVFGGFPRSQLSSEAVGEPPGTGGPIELEMNASARVPFPPEGGGSGNATGFTVTEVSLGAFELPSLDTPAGVPATITLVLPDGLELDYDSVQGATVQESETEDGRKAYTFTPDGSGSGSPTIQNANIVVNHPFVWDLFWPLLLFLFLVLVVLPAVVILLVIRRRREEDEPRTDESPSTPGTRSAPGQEAGGSSTPDEGSSRD